jgi:cell division protein FtsB
MSISPATQVRHRIPRIAEAAVERARLTVVPRTRSRAARVPFVALVSILLVGGVVGLLLFNTSMQQASFATTALEEQARTLSAREQSLEMDLEQLRDPQVLAESAVKAGMVPPPPPCFLHLDGAIEGTCTPAVAVAALPIASPPPVKPALLAPAPIIQRAPKPAGRDDATGTGTSGGDRGGDRAGNRSGNRSGDTARGDGARGGADGRTGHQQNHQSQQSQQTPTRTR